MIGGGYYMNTKKWATFAFAFGLGIFVATAGSDVYAQVKTMIGQKVTGEYIVKVNGETLSEKGAVINSKANVPVRALSEALGADVKMYGKTIIITSDDLSVDQPGTTEPSQPITDDPVMPIDNKYSSKTKNELLNEKYAIEEKLALVKERKEKDETTYANMQKNGRVEAEEVWLQSIRISGEKIEQYTDDLRLINDALKVFE
jgi:hypothetical protein